MFSCLLCGSLPDISCLHCRTRSCFVKAVLFQAGAYLRYNGLVQKKAVLVGVLKSKSDLRILLEEKWYRIPVAFLPKKKFTHIAFYQPIQFGRSGKRIEYYARVAKREVKKRVELLPSEPEHPRACEPYLKCSFRSVEKLPRPIRNIIPRRVSFGFTDLNTLRSARDILQLYGVPATEQIIEKELRRIGIRPNTEYGIMNSGKRYRIDLAIFCKKGKIAIECDNRKAHASKIQRQKDRQKDAALKHLGWRLIRLTEEDILEQLYSCISGIQRAIRSLNGVLPPHLFRGED